MPRFVKLAFILAVFCMLALPVRADIITGTLVTPTDVHIYQIHVTDADGFVASTVNPFTDCCLDTMLFLFTEAGVGIAGNDDYSTNPWDPRSYLAVDLESLGYHEGTYYLAISSYRMAPFDADGNEIFPDMWSTGVFLADPTAGGLAHFVDTDRYTDELDTGRYRIDLTGASPVPEPGTFLLLGTGIATLARRLGRKTR